MTELGIREILGLVALAFGVFFFAVGTFGLVRFKDLYVRIHSAGMISTLGIYSFILAALLLHYGMTWKVLVLGLLMFLVQPVSSQIIAQAAYQSGLKPTDALRDDLEGKIEIHPDEIQDLDTHDE